MAKVGTTRLKVVNLFLRDQFNQEDRTIVNESRPVFFRGANVVICLERQGVGRGRYTLQAIVLQHLECVNGDPLNTSP